MNFSNSDKNVEDLQNTFLIKSSDTIKKIENIIQQTIQHIRLSGIEKSRELLIVNEILDVRTENRRMLASIKQYIDEIRITTNMNNNKDIIINNLEQQLKETQSLINKKEKEYEDKYNEQYNTEVLIINEKHNKQLLLVNIKYQEQIMKLENKINDIILEKEKYLKHKVDLSVEDRIGSIKEEYLKKFNKKIEEYKQTIVSLSHQVKEKDDFISKQNQQIFTSKDDLNNLLLKNKALEESYCAIKLREKDLQLSIGNLIEQNKQLDHENLDLKKQFDQKQKELLEKDDIHEKELIKLDNRIRKILAGKDQELSKIRGILRTKESKLKSTEDALQMLNSDIINIKKH